MPFTSRRVSTSTPAVVAILTGVGLAWIGTRTAAQPAVMIDADDIGGVVRSASGPEAGVWVIAETDDLATKYRKTVVTDDQGRYVLPDLPVFDGPTATGQQCPQGWTLWATPGPQMAGVDDHGSADFHYCNWVDQFDTLGLGPNVPIATGSTSDSLLAFLPNEEEYVVMRVPYPLGFYSRGLDGRIDDPDAGWKGRGVWAGPRWHTRGRRLGRLALGA